LGANLVAGNNTIEVQPLDVNTQLDVNDLFTVSFMQQRPHYRFSVLASAEYRPWFLTARRMRSIPSAVFGCIRCPALTSLVSRFCRNAVVLLVVDLAAVLVFRLVGLLLLLRGQRATVGDAFIVDLLSYLRLICIGASRLA